MEKIWNQAYTVKYFPSLITKWEIQEPRKDEVRDGEIVKLRQYKVSGKGPDGYFTIGYYDTKDEAVAEVDRLDSMGDTEAVDDVEQSEEKGE